MGRMDLNTPEKPDQALRQRRVEIAHQWYLAIASAGGFQLDRTEALQKFAVLTDRVIDFLLAGDPPDQAAYEIGTLLADLPCLDSNAIVISGDLWTRQIQECLSSVELDRLHLRMGALFTGMTAGFINRSRAIVLAEQEEVRSAMAADLLHATEELKKYQNKLEEMLSERTRELRESEEKFRVIAETSLDGIFQSTEDSDPGKLIYVNNAFAAMLGYSQAELLGRTTLSLMYRNEIPATVTRNIRENQPAHGEFRLIHKDGHLVDIHFSVVPTMLNGRIVRSGILQDITEKKRVQASLFQSQERYRTLAEASPDMIFIIGPDDQIQYVNSFACAFLNSSAEAIIGKPHKDFFPPSSWKLHKKNFQRVLKNGRKQYSEEETRINLQNIWLGTWLVPLRDASGSINAIMEVSRDITEQKQAEMEILHSRDLLEKRVAERTEALSHSQAQLRHLTDQLVSSLEDERRRISRELHDEAGQALISLKYGLASIQAAIPESNMPARRLLDDLMDTNDLVMDQIRAISHSLRPPVLEIVGIDLSLKDYCEEFSTRTRLAVHYQGQEIPNLPDEIGISLYRFVQEALTNILKHAQATRVDVSLQYLQGQIILAVSDNGHGMDYTPHNNGIGLVGIQERLNLFNGSLQIDSPRDQGVTITARLPWPRPVDKGGEAA
jgi:PAS domain S-box-containing protein